MVNDDDGNSSLHKFPQWQQSVVNLGRVVLIADRHVAHQRIYYQDVSPVFNAILHGLSDPFFPERHCRSCGKWPHVPADMVTDPDDICSLCDGRAILLTQDKHTRWLSSQPEKFPTIL